MMQLPPPSASFHPLDVAPAVSRSSWRAPLDCRSSSRRCRPWPAHSISSRCTPTTGPSPGSEACWSAFFRCYSITRGRHVVASLEPSKPGPCCCSSAQLANGLDHEWYDVDHIGRVRHGRSRDDLGGASVPKCLLGRVSEQRMHRDAHRRTQARADKTLQRRTCLRQATAGRAVGYQAARTSRPGTICLLLTAL